MSSGGARAEPWPLGIAGDRVTAWFVEHVAGARPPLRFEVVAGGHSNLTFAVTDASDRRFVLRRPPLGHTLTSAHDMAREHRIIAALEASDVPVPRALGLCSDASVNGEPFYVMTFVDGRVVRDSDAATALLDEAGRRRAGESIVDVLARIHAVDVDAVGLGDLGRRDEYIPRQLKRWYAQFLASNSETMRPVPLVHELHDRLAAAVPEQQGTSIVHGDYRLDNCIVTEDGTVAAVLDWELSTLGDPLADLGLLAVYWDRPNDGLGALGPAPTTAPGFPPVADVVARYASISDRDVSALDYYIAFAHWKLACIVEGVFARYAAGAMGDATGFEGFRAQVVAYARRAADIADRAGIG